MRLHHALRAAAARHNNGIPSDGLLVELLFDDLTNTVGDDAVLAGSAYIDSARTLGGHNTLRVNNSQSTTASHGVYIPDSLPINLANEFTASIWIYRPANWNPSNHQYVNIFGKGSIYSSDPTLNVYERSLSNSAQFAGNIAAGGGYFSSLSQFTNDWHNIVIENDPLSDTRKMWVDTVLWSEATANTVSGVNQYLGLGHDTGSVRSEAAWYGNLGLFRLWDRKISESSRVLLYEEGIS